MALRPRLATGLPLSVVLWVFSGGIIAQSCEKSVKRLNDGFCGGQFGVLLKQIVSFPLIKARWK